MEGRSHRPGRPAPRIAPSGLGRSACLSTWLLGGCLVPVGYACVMNECDRFEIGNGAGAPAGLCAFGGCRIGAIVAGSRSRQIIRSLNKVAMVLLVGSGAPSSQRAGQRAEEGSRPAVALNTERFVSDGTTMGPRSKDRIDPAPADTGQSIACRRLRRSPRSRTSNKQKPGHVSILFQYRFLSLGPLLRDCDDAQDGVGQPACLPPEARLNAPPSPHKTCLTPAPPTLRGPESMHHHNLHPRSSSTSTAHTTCAPLLFFYGQSAGGPSGMNTWIPSKSLVSFTCTFLD